jgi:phosphoserine phosphatase
MLEYAVLVASPRALPDGLILVFQHPFKRIGIKIPWNAEQQAMKEIILINISGADKPGLTSAITGMLARYRINILDIGQAVIHNTLSLGMLVEVPPESESAPILKDVLFCAHKLGVSTQFTPIDEDTYRQWVGLQGKPRYIITLLARKITAEQISAVTSIVVQNDLNIDQISRLSGRIPLTGTTGRSKACVEFSLRGQPENPDKMRADLFGAAETLAVDLAFQQDTLFRRNCRLVAFDMDSTLIESEVIDELAKAAGVGDQVSRITARAMQGELDFKASLKKRVALLKALKKPRCTRSQQVFSSPRVLKNSSAP